MIKVENLIKTFRDGDESTTVLNGVTFEIPRGAWVSIMGPSGSGKSTLLSLLAGLDVPTRGEIWVDGTSLSNKSEEERSALRALKFGFVFQSFRLLPTLTALENVELPLEILRSARPSGAALERHKARELLERVGLGHRLDHLPTELSGGEQQRVALARAFVAAPPVILADEPTGNLDSKNGEKVLQLIRELQKEHCTTFVVVTHDPAIAQKGDREIHLKDGEVVP